MISVIDRAENIVGKGDNAGYQCFQVFFLKAVESGLYHKELNLYQTKRHLENIVGKGENAGDQCFQVFFLKAVESRDCIVKS